MRKDSRRRSVIFLSMAVAAIIAATPMNRRPAPNSSRFEYLTRAERQTVKKTEEITRQGGSSAGAADHAKGTISDPVPARPDGSSKPGFSEEREKAVLSLIRYPWEELGFSVTFMNSRPGYRAMTLTRERRIEVYVRNGEDPIHQAYDLAHELGHAFDLSFNTDERRRKWCELRGIDPSTPWFGCDACPDYNTPAGDFAETFAFLLLGPGDYHSIIAPTPTLDQIAELAEFCQIEHVAEVFRKPEVLSASAGKAGKTRTGSKRRRTGSASAGNRQALAETVPPLIQAPEQASPPELERPIHTGPIEVRSIQAIAPIPVLHEELIPQIPPAGWR